MNRTTDSLMTQMEDQLTGRQTLHPEILDRIQRELYRLVHAIKERQADSGTLTLTLKVTNDEKEGLIVEVTLKDTATVKSRYLPTGGQMVFLT